MNNALILGGSSGLGLKIAERLQTGHTKVFVTGRTDPKHSDIIFIQSEVTNSLEFENLFNKIPGYIDTLVFSASYFQEGTLTDLSTEEIQTMLHLSLLQPVIVLRDLLRKQNSLKVLLSIGSTSQFVPQRIEPVYCAAKAGLAHFVNSMAKDGRIEKTLLAAPGGMNTPFWRKNPRSVPLLDPEWVAEQILLELQQPFTYRFIKIPRIFPSKIEVVETRTEDTLKK